MVVAGSQHGELVAANARTGKLLWRFATDGKIESAPTIVDRSVFFGSTDGKLYKLDLTTGTPLWDAPHKTEGAITSSPAVGGGVVVFQNDQNRTFAINAEDGGFLWDHIRPRPEPFTIKGEGGATIANKVVYVGYDDGSVVAHALRDGATEWRTNLSGDARQFVDVDTRPLVHGRMVYVGCYSNGIYALGRKHGDIKWFHRVKGARTPAIGDGRLYISTADKELQALDTATGHLLWRLKIVYGALGVPLYEGKRLWVPTSDALMWVNPRDGMVEVRIGPDDGQTAPVAARGSWLHFVTNSGALVGARVY